MADFERQASHLRSVPHHYSIGGARHRLGSAVDRFGRQLVIYGGGRLQLFFLALLLHSGVVGKVEDEVTEERGLGHDDFYQGHPRRQVH